MTPGSCHSIRDALGAFVDGELVGADMLRTSAHVEGCESCAAELEALRRVGDVLRDTARLTPSPAQAGLADGVLARVRAEQRQSWSALVERACGDWHWAIVGFGSVTATSLVTLLAAAVLAFGPAPLRSDSLSARLDGGGLQSPSLVWVQDDSDRDVMLNHQAWGRLVQQRDMGDVAYATFIGPSEGDLALALSDLFTGERGFVDYHGMSDDDRRYTEELLYRIKRRRSSTNRVELWASTTVSASGL